MQFIHSFVKVSIHHMLLFIGWEKARGCRIEQFQYITCYSLSDVGEDGDSRLPGFNTSHVTLYQDMVGVGILIPEFQYITCYSLS